MNEMDWQCKQLGERTKLLHEDDPIDERQKDIWNLKWMKANIGYMSIDYRSGCYRSLEHAIAALEKGE